MSKRYDDELLWLQEELLNAEEEEYEEYEEYEEDLFDEDDDLTWEDGDGEEDAGGMDEAIAMVTRRYGRGSPKKFEDRDFFQDDVDDSELIYKKDYKKAKRKKARKNFGLVLLAILELTGIVAVLLWWASWAR